MGMTRIVRIFVAKSPHFDHTEAKLPGGLEGVGEGAGDGIEESVLLRATGA
jgi:hypothetical protein